MFEMLPAARLKWVYEFWRLRMKGGMNNSGYRSADAVLDRIRGALTDEEVRRGATELQRGSARRSPRGIPGLAGDD